MYRLNVDNTNVVIPTPISWSEFTTRNKWDLGKIVQPKHIIQTKPTLIIEDDQGNAQIKFNPIRKRNPKITSGRHSLESKMETISRISSQSRGVDFQPNIPNPEYTSVVREEWRSPSPTMLDMTPATKSA